MRLRHTALLALALAACGAKPVEDTSGNGSGTPDAGTASTCPEDDGSRPSARGEFAAGIDGELGQLVIFGGDSGVQQQCIPSPKFEGDTWVFDLACGSWKKLDVEGPSPRARVASAMDTDTHRLLVFGGRYRAGSSGNYTLYAETWAFDLGAKTWTKLETTGTGPMGLANATATYDPKRKALLVFGGNSSASGLTFTPHHELWSLDLGTNVWSRLGTASADQPPSREFHAATLDAEHDRLVVYSGGDANAFQGPFIGDMWFFDLAAGTWSASDADGAWPKNRIRHQLAADPQNHRLLVFAGHDDQNMGERNDLYAFDTAQNRWSEVRPGDKLHNGSAGFCDFPADFTEPDLQSPERRDGHFFGFDAKRGKFLTFAGKTDCGNVNDVWELDPATDTWTKVLPAFSGESCVRSGKQDCTSLCF